MNIKLVLTVTSDQKHLNQQKKFLKKHFLVKLFENMKKAIPNVVRNQIKGMLLCAVGGKAKPLLANLAMCISL